MTQQDFMQLTREQWKEYCQGHPSVSGTPGFRKHFEFIFTKAFNLGVKSMQSQSLMAQLECLPSDALKRIVIRLMSEDKLSVTDVMNAFIAKIEQSEKETWKKYTHLAYMVSWLAHDYKKNRDKNLSKIIKHLVDERLINDMND